MSNLTLVLFYLLLLIHVYQYGINSFNWLKNREKKRTKIGYHDLKTNTMLFFTKEELKTYLDKQDLSNDIVFKSPFVNDAATPFINDIQSGLFSQDTIARYDTKSFINLNKKEK